MQFILEYQYIKPINLNLYWIPVHLWSDNLIDFCYSKYLNPSEQKRADQYKSIPAKKLFISCRAVLKYYLNLDNQTEFEYTSTGKPYLKKLDNQNNYSFNISHTVFNKKYLGLVGIYKNSKSKFKSNIELGLDIEAQRIIKNPIELAKRFFHPKEYSFIKNHINSLKAFYRIWTLKESIVKANGNGIANGFDQFDVSECLNQDLELYIDLISNYSLYTVNPPKNIHWEDCMAAVCLFK